MNIAKFIQMVTLAWIRVVQDAFSPLMREREDVELVWLLLMKAGW